MPDTEPGTLQRVARYLRRAPASVGQRLVQAAFLLLSLGLVCGLVYFAVVFCGRVWGRTGAQVVLAAGIPFVAFSLSGLIAWLDTLSGNIQDCDR